MRVWKRRGKNEHPEKETELYRYVWFLCSLCTCFGNTGKCRCRGTKTVKIGYYEAHDFQEGADDSAAKVDIVTNIFRRLLHIQGGVTNMYMGNGKIFMKS